MEASENYIYFHMPGYINRQPESVTMVPLERDYPIVEIFMEKLHPELSGDEIISYSLAEWIVSHKHELRYSAILGMEVEHCREVEAWMKKKISA